MHTQTAGRQDLARRIAFLETDIGTMTADEEARRLSQLQRLREQYGDEDETLSQAIARREREVLQAQRAGEYGSEW